MYPEPSAETNLGHRTSHRIPLAITTMIALTLGTIAFGTGSAGAANAGSVMCVNQAPVVGVWVQVSGGQSGWAYRSGSGYRQSWSFNTQGKPYRLDVGCGGTAQRWASRSTTGTYSRSWSNVNCYPGWVYGSASVSVHDRCF